MATDTAGGPTAGDDGPLPSAPPLGLASRRGALVLAGEEIGPTRLWGRLFVSRHLVIAALAIIVGALPEFGDDRLLVAALLLFGLLPYDIGVHLYARRHRHLPISMPFVYAPIPAAFVIAFPEVWLVALVGALGNLTLFAVTFDLRIALLSGLGTAAAFGAAVPIADPELGRAGALAFGVVWPAVVLGVGALLEALQLSEERYRNYVENASDMIYVHDLDGTFLSANETALRVTGYTRQEFGKVNATEIVAPEYVDEAFERIGRAAASGRSLSETTPWELEIVTKDGRRVPVEVNTRVIFHRGRPVALQGIARDITERKQVEQQRAALDRARSEFIANAAHELRTPLTTLAGLASVLAADRGATTERELVDSLEALARQGRRVQLLADRLLDLSVIELGGIEAGREPVEVKEVVDQALEDTPPPDGTAVEVAVTSGARALGDAVRLREILTNLLANAYRYGGRAVRVEAAPANGHIELTVADDGPGVPADLVPRLFEPFTRGDDEGGTGLGLAICARLAHALEGELVYEAGEPTGARFILRVPVATA